MKDQGHRCTETLREIELYLDGEADDALRDRIEGHLADCTPCMDRADFRTHLKALVRERCHEDRVPDGLSAKILAMLHDPA
jgi:mycothiol system anti-sigma-R factor